MENENAVNNVPTNEAKKKKGKKKWIIIAVIAVLLFAIFASSGDSEPTVDPLPDNSTQQTTVDATKEIKAGSSVTSDELIISYKSCNADFKKYSSYADVKNGYKVIQAVFDFENVSETDQMLDTFNCYADGVKCDTFYSVDDYSDPSYETISAGRKLLDGAVYFEVPKDAEVIELEYETNYWTEEKYIFIVE